MRDSRAGFTLVELLVAMFITGLLGIITIQFFTSTSRGMNEQTYIATQTGAVQRTLGVIGDDIRRAETVVSSGLATVLPMGSLSVTPPAATGTQRLDLYVVTPAGSECTTAYEYRSYFTVARSTLTGTTVNTWLRLPADSANDTRSVLLQYLGCAANLTTVPTFSGVRVVSDYINTLTITQTGAGAVTVSVQSARTLNGRTLRSPQVPAVGTYYSRRN